MENITFSSICSQLHDIFPHSASGLWYDTGYIRQTGTDTIHIFYSILKDFETHDAARSQPVFRASSVCMFIRTEQAEASFCFQLPW